MQLKQERCVNYFHRNRREGHASPKRLRGAKSRLAPLPARFEPSSYEFQPGRYSSATSEPYPAGIFAVISRFINVDHHRHYCVGTELLTGL